MEEQKITYELIIRLSQRPKEFLEWTRNYFLSYISGFKDQIHMYPYFVASPTKKMYFASNDQLGILGCFGYDNTFQIITNSVREDLNPKGDLQMINLISKYLDLDLSKQIVQEDYRNGYTLNVDDVFPDLKRPKVYDILSLLLESGNRRQETNELLILNERVNIFPKSTLVYGMMEFIIHNKLQRSRIFCFIYGMLYYMIYVARSINEIYFGDLDFAVNGFVLQPLAKIPDYQPTLYYPDTFNEFRNMFIGYYLYIQSHDTQFEPEKEFMAYFYETNQDDPKLNGYLVASSGNQLYEVFNTDVFHLFVEKYQDRFSALYDRMRTENNVDVYYRQRVSNFTKLKLLGNKKNKVEVERLYLDDLNMWLHSNKDEKISDMEFEFELLLNSYQARTPEYEFIKLCIVMVNLCGWHTLVFVDNKLQSPDEIPVVGNDFDFGSPSPSIQAVKQELYSDIVYNELLPQMQPDELVRVCMSDKKYQRLCQQKDFKKTYEQQHFTITYDLMIKLSERPKEFLRWVRNYFKWYAFTNEISMNACFILPFYQNQCFINTDGDGIVGCFLNDDIYNSLEDAAVAVVSAINKYYTLEYHIKRYFKSEKGIKFKDNTKLPDIYDILTILLEDGNTLSKDNRTKNSLQLLLNETIMMYPHSTITYGMLDFIIYHGLNDSPQFCFILGMMYYLIGEKAINKIYFGDIKVLSYGFEQDDNMLLLYDDEPPTLEFPDTFDEFRQMFMRYYSYIQNNNIRLSPNRNFIAYIYDIFEDQLGLDGYFITPDNDGNQLHEIFGTVLLNSYIDNHKDRIDYIYTMMLGDIGDRIYSTESGRGFYDKDVDVSYLQRALRWLLRLNNNTTYEGYRNIMLELTGQPLYRLRFDKVAYEIDQKMMVEDPYYYSDGEDTLDEDKPITSWKNETFYTTEFKRLLKGRAVKSVEYQFIEMCMVMLNLCGYNVLMYLDLQ